MAPILTGDSYELLSHSARQTQRIGEALGHLLRPGDVVCLEGNLGTGKTCLVKGIGAGMDVAGTITSPTFVFIGEYASMGTGPYLYHADLYRIIDPKSILSLGLEDYMYGDGVTVIEWADRAKDFLPPERLWVSLSYVEFAKRALRFEAVGAHYREVLFALKASLLARPAPRPPQ